MLKPQSGRRICDTNISFRFTSQSNNHGNELKFLISFRRKLKAHSEFSLTQMFGGSEGEMGGRGGRCNKKWEKLARHQKREDVSLCTNVSN